MNPSSYNFPVIFIAKSIAKAIATYCIFIAKTLLFLLLYNL